MSYQLLRLPDVIKKTGLSRSSIYAKIKFGEFPKPCKISERISVWDSNIIDSWIESKLTESSDFNHGSES